MLCRFLVDYSFRFVFLVDFAGSVDFLSYFFFPFFSRCSISLARETELLVAKRVACLVGDGVRSFVR